MTVYESKTGGPSCGQCEALGIELEHIARCPKVSTSERIALFRALNQFGQLHRQLELLVPRLALARDAIWRVAECIAQQGPQERVD